MKRHQTKAKNTKYKAILAGLSAAIALYALLSLGGLAEYPLLMAPFGASCVLIFLVPESPLSQPRNVIGGHMLSSLIGFMFLALYTYTSSTFVDSNIVIPLAVGLAISSMAILKVIHPPAGADPIVILLAQPGLEFLLFPVLTGSVLLVLFGILQQQLIKRFNLFSKQEKYNDKTL